MKYLVCILLTLLTIFFTMQRTSYGASLNVGEPRTVRMIYFLPNDRPFRANVVREIKDGIRRIQAFYAEQMHVHGYGRKTFRFETNAKGEPKVYRVDGQSPDSYYVAEKRGFLQEIDQKFDTSKNIYLIVLDNNPLPSGGYGWSNDKKNGGGAVVDDGFHFLAAAHELGHAFGLRHDFRDDTYIMSYGGGWREGLSACAAQSLAVHPYFNPDIPLEVGPAPTIELISPGIYPAGSERVTIRLKVRDADGLHQVRLSASGGLQACRALAGKKNAIVEFDYKGAVSRYRFIGLGDAASHTFEVDAIDTNGNYSGYLSFTIAEKSPHHLATLVGAPPEYTTFEGSRISLNRVESLMFSPDGRMLATGTEFAVRLWDVATRTEIATFPGGLHYSVVFSPDGRMLATGKVDAVRLWDVATQGHIATLEGHTTHVLSIAFSPDGKTLASGSSDADASVRVWDIATRTKIATFEQRTRVLSVAFSSDGRMLAIGTVREASLWDVATRTKIATFEHDAWINSVAFSPDGKTLALGMLEISNGEGLVELWDIPAKRTVGVFKRELGVNSVAFSPDGTILASGSWDGNVTLRDVATGIHIKDLPHTSHVNAVAFQQDGRLLAVGTEEGEIILWDTSAIVADFQRETQRPVTIPDTNLRTKIAEALNKPPSVQLTLMDLLRLTELQAPTANIQDITGLEHAQNLTDLNLDNNNISDVSPLIRVRARIETQQIRVSIRRNPLSYTSINAHIPAMQANNIHVEHDGVAHPELLKISGDRQNNTVGEPLPKPFVVEAINIYGEPMKGVFVTFAITTGGGRLSATTATTNTKGRAQTTFTLGQTGKHTVRASAMGIQSSVIFTANADAPPIYWIKKNNGTLHRSQGATVKSLVPSVQNATSLAVDMTGGRLYWTEQTGKTTGKIQRANLDGSNVQLVKELTSVPQGLAIDVVNGKLYLTNAWGKIQRLNLDGANFEPNLIKGLESPKSIALDVAGGKLYWMEQTGKTTGKIQRANLGGSNVQLVRELTSVPRGIALDTVNSKLYLTNAWGKIQRLNLGGANFEPNLITGLDSPEGIAVDIAGGKLYWTETNSIKCADLSGANVQEVVAGLSTPTSIALSIVPVEPVIAAAPAGLTGLPTATGLLPNYPNPFNPETWIPYQLAKSSEVTLHIYAVNGALVRTLGLGHQPAGVYRIRSRAAYWDGRNTIGEKVASGIYFYTLTAGDFTATRKLLIRK